MDYITHKDGSFNLINRYGSFYFKNDIKFFKFQMQCDHEYSILIKDNHEVVETICDRCDLLLSETRGREIITFDDWFAHIRKELTGRKDVCGC